MEGEQRVGGTLARHPTGTLAHTTQRTGGRRLLVVEHACAGKVGSGFSLGHLFSWDAVDVHRLVICPHRTCFRPVVRPLNRGVRREGTVRWFVRYGRAWWHLMG